MNKHESLAKASKELILTEPFYGLFLLNLNKTWSKLIPTLGVNMHNLNYNLIINEDFWNQYDLEIQKHLLMHELIHIGFFHLVNYNKYADKEILNIAMDLVVNQVIGKHNLPEEGCFIENFSHLNLEINQSTNYYYKKLRENQDDPIVQQYINSMAGSHDYSDVGDLPEAAQKLIEAQTGHILKEVADQVEKSRGIIPGAFAGIIEKLRYIEPPKFDWKGYVRRFAGKSIKKYTKSSRRTLNKRIPEMPGLKHKQLKHILFAIDTSGSVSDNELKECLNELHHIQKTGSEVTVIQCDTAISHIGPLDLTGDFKIHGRGGTSYDPVVDYYIANKHKYSCLMYFTDGEAPPPENYTSDILWILSEQSEMNKELPGRVIRLEL